MKTFHRALWPMGFVAGLGALAVVLTSNHTDQVGLQAALTLLLGWSFIASGLFAWSWQPENPFGALMVAEGFAWFAVSLAAANASLPFTIGLLLSNLAFGVLAHLLLAFPRGRLESRISRLIVAVVYVDVLLVQLVMLFFYEPSAHDCDGCPSNLLLIDRRDGLADALNGISEVIGAISLLAIVAIFVQRWRAASGPARRVLGPVIWTGGLALALLAAALVASFISKTASDVFFVVALVFFVLIPIAFISSQLIARFARLTVVRLLVDLVQNQAPGGLREALARALRDPSLELAYWIPQAGAYVNETGLAVELPAAGSGRATTLVERDGRRIGALVHDASLADNQELLDAVSAGAALSLENARLQAELLARLEDLRASEERLRALFDASPVAIIELDLDGVVTFWNPAAETLFGWQAGEVLGDPVPFVPADRRDEIPGIRERLRRGESIYGLESVRLRKDGSSVDVVLSAAPVLDGERKVVRFMAAFADISARLRAQGELRQERDFISAVLDTAAMLVIVTDPDGRLVRFNRACELLTGYRFDEVRGRPFWEFFIPPEEVAHVRAAVGGVWRGEFPNENENHWILKDGSRRLIAWSNTVLLDAEGEIEYMVSSGLDITERKRAEEEVRASRMRIVEAGDSERRRLERNLHDGAQQRLVALSLALRMAHSEVRANPEVAEQLVTAAGEELTVALTELRELARGIHPAVLTDRGLPAALEALAGRATMPVEVEIEPETRFPAPIEAAAYYVVSEALANVAKYAEASLVTVTVGRENGEALVQVSDDGVGGADLARGSGLRGLRDRVEALDGALEVESAPGSGTRVRARIPVEG